MRPIHTLSGLALLLAGTDAPCAEDMRITVPEVEVRSGPGTNFYPTSKLRQGDAVKVVKEESGYWAIEPPAGSFSWINTLFLAQTPTAPGFVHVKGNRVPVRVGSSISNDEPTTQRVTLDQGTIVRVLDPRGAATKDGNWLPIEPPAQEYRYIPADSVKPQSQAQVQTVNSAPIGAAPVFSPPGQAAPSGLTLADDQLLAQAEAAERKGNTAEARRLYQQLAHLTKDHELMVKCVNRDHQLAEGHPGSVPPGYRPGTPSTNTYPPQYTYGNRAAAPQGQPALQSPVPPPPGYSSYTYRPESSAQPRTPAVTASYVRPAPEPSGAPTQRIGRLRRAPFSVDQKPAYALDDEKGEPILYVTAQPGVNLDAFLRKRVEISGPEKYRPEMYHKNHMIVEQVRERP